jgi:glycosyltransferase involved in cell wall biosynthesis
MSDLEPRVTIGVPTYNGERYLRKALDSILAQTFCALDIVIFNNGSTDRTEQICQDYLARDGRIRYHRSDTNLGGAYSQSRVVELARCEYFKWAHDDDLHDPHFVERCVEVLDRNPSVVVCYTRTTFIDENDCPLRDDPKSVACPSPRPSARLGHMLRAFHEHAMSNALFGVMRTEVLRRTPLIATYPCADRNLLAELALHGEIHEIPEVLFFRRDHPRRSMRANKSMHAVDLWVNPQKRGRRTLLRWKWLSEYVKSIHKVPMDLQERLRCYRQMLRWCKWNLRGLSGDAMRTNPLTGLIVTLLTDARL